MTTPFISPTPPPPIRRTSDRHSLPRTRGGGRLAARVIATGLATGVLLLTGLSTASAHVHVDADSTVTGQDAALTFRVPNESASAGTVKVSVQLPQDHPFLSVSAEPVAGWAITRTMRPLPEPQQDDGATITKAVRSVTWTAGRGTQIAEGQYQEFSLSVGPLPDPGPVPLPVVQTYSDGSVVRWNQATPASGAEPEHPAPVLDVTTAAVTATAGVGHSAPDATARWLAGVSLALAVLSAGIAVLGLSRTRPRTA